MGWVAAVLAMATIPVIADPMSYGFRDILATCAGLLAAMAMVAAVACRRRRLVVASAAVACCLAWVVTTPSRDLAHDLAFDGPTVRARRLVVGYDDPVVPRVLAGHGLIGGVFLTRRNVGGRTPAEVAAEVASFQAAAAGGGFPPLVVAVDQEGGPVSHVSPPLPVPAAPSTLASLPEGERQGAARSLGRSVGEGLRKLGATMDLAPVVDLRPASPPGGLDLHTLISTRAVSGDPAVVADVATGFAHGLLDAGVTPVAKHFPGLGSVVGDTHLAGASNGKSRERLDREDLVPFRALTGVAGAAVMVSHAAMEAVDPGVPSSTSRRVVTGLLKDDMRAGLVVTDDMTMGAIVHGGLCKGILSALNAGADLVMVTWDVARVPTAVRCVLDSDAVSRGSGGDRMRGRWGAKA